MIVAEQHKIDASEQDENGQYDYYYAYTDITFTDESAITALMFRFYDHDQEVFLQAMREDEEIVAVYDGKQEYKIIKSYLHPIARHKRFPRHLPLFRDACKFLRDEKGLLLLKVYKQTSRGEPFSRFSLVDFID